MKPRQSFMGFRMLCIFAMNGAQSCGSWSKHQICAHTSPWTLYWARQKVWDLSSSNPSVRWPCDGEWDQTWAFLLPSPHTLRPIGVAARRRREQISKGGLEQIPTGGLSLVANQQVNPFQCQRRLVAAGTWMAEPGRAPPAVAGDSPHPKEKPLHWYFPCLRVALTESSLPFFSIPATQQCTHSTDEATLMIGSIQAMLITGEGQPPWPEQIIYWGTLCSNPT